MKINYSEASEVEFEVQYEVQMKYKSSSCFESKDLSRGAKAPRQQRDDAVVA